MGLTVSENYRPEVIGTGFAFGSVAPQEQCGTCNQKYSRARTEWQLGCSSRAWVSRDGEHGGALIAVFLEESRRSDSGLFGVEGTAVLQNLGSKLFGPCAAPSFELTVAHSAHNSGYHSAIGYGCITGASSNLGFSVGGLLGLGRSSCTLTPVLELNIRQRPSTVEHDPLDDKLSRVMARADELQAVTLSLAFIASDQRCMRLIKDEQPFRDRWEVIRDAFESAVIDAVDSVRSSVKHVPGLPSPSPSRVVIGLKTLFPQKGAQYPGDNGPRVMIYNSRSDSTRHCVSVTL